MSCTTDRNNSRNHIRRVKVSIINPEEIYNGKTYSLDIDIYINYYKEYVVYELPYHTLNWFSDGSHTDSLGYEFFICEESTRKGYLLKNIGDSLLKKIPGDSIIYSRAYDGGKGDKDMLAGFKINSLIKIADTPFVTYRYVFDHHFYDSAYFQYDISLKDVTFSFSRKLDSVQDSKLSKIMLFIKHDKELVPPGIKEDFFIARFEMKDATRADESALRNLFERFIKKENENNR
ncbi:hypothetical protein [Ferruginibacter sp.]